MNPLAFPGVATLILHPFTCNTCSSSADHRQAEIDSDSESRFGSLQKHVSSSSSQISTQRNCVICAEKKLFIIVYCLYTSDKEGKTLDDLPGVVFPSFFIIVNAFLIKLQIHKKVEDYLKRKRVKLSCYTQVINS